MGLCRSFKILKDPAKIFSRVKSPDVVQPLPYRLNKLDEETTLERHINQDVVSNDTRQTSIDI